VNQAMAARPDYFKLGLFVVVAATIAVAAVILLAAGKLFRTHVEVETYVDESVQTLAVGSAVKFRGVEVGHVREITFVRTMLPPDHPDFIRYGRYVMIRMSLFADVFEDLTGSDVERVLERLIADGLRVRLASQGLTGQTHLEVDHVSPTDNPPLKISWEPKTYYIPSAPSLITRLTQTADRVFSQIEEADIPNLAANLDRFLVVSTQTVQEARVALLSENVLALVAGLTQTNQRLQTVLASPELETIPGDLAGAARSGRSLVDDAATEVGSMLSDLRATSQSLRATAAEIEELATGAEVRASFAELAAASPAIRKAAEELPRTLASLTAGLRRAERILSGGDGDVEVLLENLRVVSENVRILSETVKVFPGQILFGGPPAPAEATSR